MQRYCAIDVQTDMKLQLILDIIMLRVVEDVNWAIV